MAPLGWWPCMPRRRATTVRVVLAGNQMRGKESDSGGGAAWACPIRPSPPARGPPHALTHASDHPAACSTEPCARLPLYSWSAAACRGRQLRTPPTRRRRRRRRGEEKKEKRTQASGQSLLHGPAHGMGPGCGSGRGAPSQLWESVHRTASQPWPMAMGGWIPDLGLAGCLPALSHHHRFARRVLRVLYACRSSTVGR
jgi:hypothetical protein